VMEACPVDSRTAYIALNMMEDIGPVSVRSLVTALGSPQAIFQAGKDDLFKAEGIGPALVEKIVSQRGRLRPDEELARARKQGYEIITPADATYPKPLLTIHDPPLALYVWGTLAPGDKRAIAVVGSRHTTLYGRETAEKFGFHLAKTGFVVVSGLARGIDTAAHRGALQGGGRTLAVLGGALDCLYPEENAELALGIARQGAVLSEFPLGRQPDKTTFPMRNRIVSGLCLGVLVVEAGPTSGALITASQALDQGRCVFAVPGRIDSPASKGSHQLLKQGARLVESVDDILEEFEFLIPPAGHGALPGRNALIQAKPDAENLPPLNPDEEKIVRALAEEELDMDTLTRTTGVPASALSVLILGLEMKRVVRMLPGRRVALIRR
ncbi:MAG: DNA-processing protein DprA, partial [Kiritimatiellaeota bacterium]|nr:DNA-processing protein DprA [Kiritimatiellota bacterium]